MKDEGVSPVVAFMLLLMVVVSFLSVLNAYYIPSLKQQAEVQHLHSVEESFSRISSDILQVLTFRQNITIKEPVELGGGDVLFSSIKSSGYLEVNSSLQSTPLSSMKISNYSNANPIKTIGVIINSSQVQYRPVGNFWINQGYQWKDGVLNVTKANRLTYLQYTDDSDGQASAERNAYYEMFKPRFEFESYENNTTNIKLDLVNLVNQSSYKATNGNGVGIIEITLDKSDEIQGEINETSKIVFINEVPDSNSIDINSTIFSTLAGYQRNNMCLISNSDNYSLELPSDAVGVVYDKKFAKYTICVWNLSISVF